MLEAFDADSIQTPASTIALDLVLNCLVAKKAAEQSAVALPARVDLTLVGARRRAALVVECGRAFEQPAVLARPQQRGVAARSVEPSPCGEFAQPRPSVTG